MLFCSDAEICGPSLSMTILRTSPPVASRNATTDGFIIVLSTATVSSLSPARASSARPGRCPLFVSTPRIVSTGANSPGHAAVRWNRPAAPGRRRRLDLDVIRIGDIMTRRSAVTTTFPDWLEPMAATLTQERFTGPEWIFERKFDGIRLLAFKQGSDVRLFSRNRLPQNIPPVARGDRESPGGGCDPRRRSDLGIGETSSTTCSTSCGSMAATSRSLRSSERRGLLGNLPLRPPLHRVPLLDDPQPWERASRRGLGRRHREAPRFAVRAPPLATLAEDEVRGRRRSSSSAASPIRRAAASVSARCSSATSRTTTSSSLERSAPASTRSCLLDLRARLDALEIPASPFTKSDRPAAAARALGAPRDRRAGRASSSGPCTTSFGTRGCSASASTSRARGRESSS